MWPSYVASLPPKRSACTTTCVSEQESTGDRRFPYPYPRLIVPGQQRQPAKIALDERCRRHALAWRLRPGAHFELGDGAGALTLARVEELNARRFTCLAERWRHTGAPSKPSLDWLQCLPKGKKFDSMLRMATELGVARIQPTASEYSVREIVPERSHHQLQRWHDLTLEAAQQCRRNHLPQLHAPVSLAQAAAAAPEERTWRVAFWEQSTVPLPPVAPPQSQRAQVLIGAEGGLSQAEAELLEQHGFGLYSLGSLILRVDTASIVALTLVRDRLQQA